MRSWKVLTVISVVLLALTCPAHAGETLYNGIELPDEWPPRCDELTRAPMPVPYLDAPPEVIPINVGRQLFVDDFLIEETSMQRVFHTPEYCEQNPVIKPGKPWENQRRGWFAAPFSGGNWYDPSDKLFKMWYTGGFLASMCYATSKDGIHWEKPELDDKDGTNVVLDPVLHGERRYFDTNTVWLNRNADDPNERYKYLATELHRDWWLVYRTSADGIRWSEPKSIKPIWGDHTTFFYNPFRDVWVLSQRIEGYPVGRCRAYLEASTMEELMELVTPNQCPRIDGLMENVAEGDSVLWAHTDDLDPHHSDPKYSHFAPQLYNLDAAPYESIMIAYFSVWQGPENEECGEFLLQKRNDILLGFSRDGFHWDRPYRGRFISSSWDESNWRFGNVQSVAGGPLVVGDSLYFYFSGRAKPQGDDWDADAATGLAILRRDGFASMDAGSNTETLTTRPVTFQGKYLFVNVDCPKGELKVEVLNEDGEVIEPFAKNDCEPLSRDETMVQVNWEGKEGLADLAGKPVRFKFYLENGSLYSFWVSPDKSGASHGYVGAGGPGFTGPTDTVGRGAA